MKRTALATRLLMLSTLLGLSSSGLSAAIITGSAISNCVGQLDSQTLSGPGSLNTSCIFNSSGNSAEAQARINGSAFGGGGDLFASGAITGVLGRATVSLSVTSQLVLTGGSGAATLYSQFFVPAASPELTCSLLLNGSPAGCYGEALNVTFGVPFTIAFTMSGEQFAGGSQGSSFLLTTQNGTNSGRLGPRPYGVYQNGNPFAGATLAEVEVPEPVHGLLAIGFMTLYAARRLSNKRA